MEHERNVYLVMSKRSLLDALWRFLRLSLTIILGIDAEKPRCESFGGIPCGELDMNCIFAANFSLFSAPLKDSAFFSRKVAASARDCTTSGWDFAMAFHDMDLIVLFSGSRLSAYVEMIAA